MKTELVDLQPQLEQSKIDNTKMMKVDMFSIVLQHPSGLQCAEVNAHTEYNSVPFR